MKENLEEKALKYSNDFVFPVKGVEYGYSYLQELKAQRDIIKDAYMAGASNNELVKIIEESIKELEKLNQEHVELSYYWELREARNILKLIQ